MNKTMNLHTTTTSLQPHTLHLNVDLKVNKKKKDASSPLIHSGTPTALQAGMYTDRLKADEFTFNFFVPSMSDSKPLPITVVSARAALVTTTTFTDQGLIKGSRRERVRFSLLAVI